MTRYRDRYEEIFRLLTRAELQRGSEGLEALEFGPELFGADRERWLGFYTHEGLRIALEKYGFYRELERLGFRKLRLETKTDDPEEHLLRIWSLEPGYREPLIELVVHRDFILDGIPVLNVQWLMLQNPATGFTAKRPPLPGQRHPGLGVGSQVLELLRNVCHRLQLEGLVTVPSHFHNAVFYSEEFFHLDPNDQGAFLGLCRDLVPQSAGKIGAASWALHWEMVRDLGAQTETFGWFQQQMVNPLSDGLQNHFQSKEYRQQVQLSLRSHEFELFRSALLRNLAARGIAPFDPEKISTWIMDQ